MPHIEISMYPGRSRELKQALAERGIPLRKHRSKKGNTGPIGVLCGLEIAPLFLRPHACR